MRILLAIRDLGYRGMPKVVASYARMLSDGNEVAIWAWNEGGQTADELRESGFKVWIGLHGKQAALQFAPKILNIHRHGVYSEEETNIIKEFKDRGATCIETNVFGRIDKTISPYVKCSIQISKWDLFQYNAWRMKAPPLGVYCPNPVPINEYRRIDSNAIGIKRQEWGITLQDHVEPPFVLGRIGNTSWSALSLPLFELLKKNRNFFLVHVADHSNQVPAWVINHPRVRIIDRIKGSAELSAFYSSCNVCISMSTIGESFGLVNVESIACGTPVVALSSPLHCNALCETVGKSRGGVVITSPSELESAVYKIYKAEDEYVNMAYARAYIYDEYDEQKVKRLLKIIFTVIDCGHGVGLEKSLNESAVMTRFTFSEVLSLMKSVNAAPDLLMRILMRIYYSRVGYVLYAAMKKLNLLSRVKVVLR